MSKLPTGRVTLVFTDIEGSTRLLHTLGSEYVEALTEHRGVVRETFHAHGGVEVDTQGDAFFFAFPAATQAVDAARKAQARLDAGPLRVRMGMHTGEPSRTSEGYVGLDVHLAARIAATGHGGQIVLSHTTCTELDGTVPVLDLGEHRVKDFDAPVLLFQVGTAAFPPLKTISNTNLPRPASSFVGRQREVEEIVELVRSGSRIVTLTGTGGAGKTRLAIESAAALVPEFGAGVFWVSLAPVRDSGLVLDTIAHTLGARDDLARHIGDRKLLLLLDDVEGVVAAAPELSRLAESCPHLHLLVTSRELLRLRGEAEYPVLPLGDDDAAELFANRSRFEPDATVVELCRALDNLPLAVELAAARVSVLSPAQILERLSQRLDLFRGARDAEPRQQTLRATIDWSHDLLTDRERRLFAHLAVFDGGCTLPAAEEIAAADLDTLEALVHKSLLRHTGERFWMLETIRSYALEQLDLSEDAPVVRRRHAEYFHAFVQRAVPELDGAKQGMWLEALEDDYANIRLVFGFPDLELSLAAALRNFWTKRGYLNEGRRRLGDVLSRAAKTASDTPKALFAAALLAVLQGDWEEARRLAGSSRELALEHADEQTAVEALLVLGRANMALGDESRAVALLEEAATAAGGNNRPVIAGFARLNLAYLALSRGDLVDARRDFESARDQFSLLADGHGHARSLAGLASVALHEERLDDAFALLGESFDVSVPTGDKDDIAWALELSGVAWASRDPVRAMTLFGAAEALRESLGATLQSVELAQHEQALSSVRGIVDATLVEGTWNAGRALPLDEAVQIARR
jgi:predicted ATPase